MIFKFHREKKGGRVREIKRASPKRDRIAQKLSSRDRINVAWKLGSGSPFFSDWPAVWNKKTKNQQKKKIPEASASHSLEEEAWSFLPNDIILTMSKRGRGEKNVNIHKEYFFFLAFYLDYFSKKKNILTIRTYIYF